MRTGALAAAVAMLLVSGCSAAPVGDTLVRRRMARRATGTVPGSSTRGRCGRGSWPPRRRLQARTGTARVALKVGALFEHAASGAHFCTASVVASPGEDPLVTAAHCISNGDGSGYKSDIIFIPDY